MGICPKKKLLEMVKQVKRIKLLLLKFRSLRTNARSFEMQADSVNKLTSVQNVSVSGDSLFILFSFTLMIYKMKKLLKIMNLIIMIKLVGLRS